MRNSPRETGWSSWPRSRRTLSSSISLARARRISSASASSPRCVAFRVARARVPSLAYAGLLCFPHVLQLQIPDDEQHNYRVYLTEAGEIQHGAPLDGNELLSYCLQNGDKSGSLKFLVQPIGGHRQQLHVDTHDLAAQVPQSNGGAGFSPLFEQNRAAAAAAAAQQKQQQHAKARSLSSGGDRNDAASGERDYNAASESDADAEDRPRPAWRPHGKAPRSSSPRPSSARDGQSVASPSQSHASPHRLARTTSPSPVSSNGTMLSVTPRQGSVTPTPPTPGGTDPSSWRPQAQQQQYGEQAFVPFSFVVARRVSVIADGSPGSFADATSPRRQMRGAFSSKKAVPPVPPPPSRAPPPVPTNVTPYAGRPVYKPLPTPTSASSPYSPRPQPYATSSSQGRQGTKAVDPRWFNVSVPGQSASPSTAQRLPLGIPPPPPPPPTQSSAHRLPPARSVGDLRGASHGGLRTRPSTAKEDTLSPTTSSPYSPRHEGLPFAPNPADYRAPGYGSRTPDPSMGRHRPPFASQRMDAYSDTEQTATMIRRQPLPISGGQLSPTSRQAEQQFAQWQSEHPAVTRGPRSPPMSPRLHSPRSPGADEATLMPKEYAHIIPLLANPADNATSVPLPPTPSPGAGNVLYEDQSRLSFHPTEPPNISSYDDDDDGDTIWNRPPQAPPPRPVITVSVNGLEAPSAPSATTPSPRSPTKTMVPSKRRPQSTFGAREGLTWNVRPVPEDVYEHLEEYFPEHDLDKPLIEMPSGASSPVGPESPAAPVPPPVAPQPPAPKADAATRAKHKKSIRIVANERRKIMDRNSKLQAEAPASDVARKRSTKLWDIKVEEVAPNVGKGGPPSAGPDSPTSSAAQRGTFTRLCRAIRLTVLLGQLSRSGSRVTSLERAPTVKFTSRSTPLLAR
ncbi:hypothetical protein EXIGLDRAFT_508150 [Exidia glandulosa HHB12029]|uniref:Uncharacterized protein n=1 Tax=Exidia glandulosa HHB12029 TaxID=1314781 RepID=A0A165PCG8_EXIGL|nr:hypothetical protein EXIGLDRAFT_508150 [Exidia glandulosa HHB12029]